VQPIDKLQNHAGLGLEHAFHNNLSCIIPHRNRNAFFVHIHTDIFGAGQKGRSSSGAVELALKTCSKRGALLYCVALSYIKWFCPDFTSPVSALMGRWENFDVLRS
jgi:hypothetical protein